MKAKQSIFLILIAVLYLMCGRASYAAEDTFNMNASVSVKPVFDITANNPSLNFGSHYPQTGYGVITETKNLRLNIKTNHNNPWDVTANVLSPLTSGMYTISDSRFIYSGSGGNGVWDTSPGHLEGSPSGPFYNCSAGEYMTLSVNLDLQFYVDIPAGQPAGLYTATIMFILKDQETNEEVETSVYVTVAVNSNFAMSVEPSSLFFSHTDPGEATDAKTLYISCLTNNNNPWNVSMRVTSELTSGVYVIPNENFHWAQGSLSGGGTWYPGTGYLDIIPHVFYEASMSEWVTGSPVELALQFYVDVPPDQVAGTYTTILVVTMTE